ncbi:MAG: baseplate assembly protein [Salinarimonadaceae bacterium]|nr:MAG: baseplate assembly protein [Salinarimonadaceae bacterium]
MAGLDARTGQILDGLPHVIQSIEKILTTRLGERVMREWVGSPGTRLLGELLTDRTIMRWWMVTWISIEIFEPRFRKARLQVPDATRLGEAGMVITGEIRPYAHLDWQQARLYVSLDDDGISIREAA